MKTLYLALSLVFWFGQSPGTQTLQSARDAVTREPGNAQAWYEFAVHLAGANRTTDAIDAYRKSVSIDPQLVDAWNNLGDLLRRTQDRSGAREAFEKALSIDASHARASLNMALVCLEARDFPGALGHLQTAKAGMGAQPVLDYLFARAYLELRDLTAAQPYLERFRQSGASPAGSLELATLLMDTNEFVPAAELLLAIPAERQTDEMKLRLGQVWMGLDRIEDALHVFRQLTSRQAESDRALLWLGYAERASGDLGAARQALEKAIRLKGDSAEALVALANLQLDDGAPEKALELADRALRLNSQNAPANLARGQALLRMDRAKEAIEPLTGIPRDSAEFQQSLYVLSRVYRLLGDFDSANAALAEFQKLERDNRTRPVPERRRE